MDAFGFSDAVLSCNHHPAQKATRFIHGGVQHVRHSETICAIQCRTVVLEKRSQINAKLLEN